MSNFKTVCTNCGSYDVLVTPFKMSNGALAIKGRCRVCERADRVAHNERPSEFVMPFGKYKGDTLSQIADDDPDYLQWLLDNADNLSSSIREKIESALGS